MKIPVETRRLTNLIERTERLLVAAAFFRGVGMAVATVIAAVLIAIALDAIFALPVTLRIAIDAALFVVVVVAIVGIFRGVAPLLRATPDSARGVARLLERRAGVTTSDLINAVDLARREAGDGSAGLIDASVRAGEDVASRLRPGTAVDRRPMWRALGRGVLFVVAAVALVFLMPRLMTTVARRYLQPTAFHPPYTLLDFEVRTAPETIYYGRDASIEVTITGPGLPDRADVVFRPSDDSADATGDAWTPAPMLFTHDAVADAKGNRVTFALPLDRLTESRSFYIDTPGGQSALYELTVLPVPLFEELTARYAYPSYTGWPSRDHPLDGRPVRALAGTQMTISARSNVPLQSGFVELEFADGSNERVEMIPRADDARRVDGVITIARSAEYRIGLVAFDGTPGDESPNGAIEAVVDGAPQIEIVQPALHVAVPEGFTVAVTLAARDDVGIERVELHRAVNGWGPYPVELDPEPAASGSGVTARWLFDLGELGARAGDVIAYFGVAWDGHPTTPAFAETPMAVIEVLTEEQYRELARREYAMEQMLQEARDLQARTEELERAREAMRDEAESLDREMASGDGPATPEDVARRAGLERGMAEYAEAARALEERVRERAERPSLYDFEEQWQRELEATADGLAAQEERAATASERMNDAARRPDDPGSQRDAAAALREFLDEQQPFGTEGAQEREETQDDLETIGMADDLVRLTEELREQILRQRALADRLGGFRDQPELTPEERLRLDGAADEQQRLHDQMRDTLEQMSARAAQAAERLPNMSGKARGYVDAVERMEVPGDQQSAVGAGRDGDGEGAHRAADDAAEKLESLLSSCSGGAMQGAGAQDLDGCLSMSRPGAAEALGQLADGRRSGRGRGMGRGQGRGRGSGSGGSEGLAGGSEPGDGTPSDGRSGSGGSPTGMQVLGPHQLVAGEPSEQEGGRPGRGSGPGEERFAQANLPEDVDPEHLTPEETTARRSGAGRLAGVPSVYRRAAEAYFRRIARDERAQRGDTDDKRSEPDDRSGPGTGD